MIDNRTVGKTIATLRQAKGMTQQQLAAAMSVSHQAVSKWENGAALPDIQTLMGLTQLFGVTVEQLLSGDVPGVLLEKEEEILPDASEDGYVSDAEGEPIGNAPAGESEEAEEAEIDLKNLLEMAPFMSRASVGEMLEKSGKKLTPAEIAKFAPFLEPTCLERMIRKCDADITWDSLRRVAPFLKREAVDAFARTLAMGEKAVKPISDEAQRVAGDVWKTMDDVSRRIEKGVDRAMRKMVKFGEGMVNEVSKAFDDLTAEPESREQRLARLRRTAFERAIEDGKWDWLAAHIDEVQDEELRRRISEEANRAGMQDWVSEHLGGYADPETIENAIANADWTWLGENVAQLDGVMQRRVAQAAMQAENWDWLGEYAEQIELNELALPLAMSARKAGARMLATQLARCELIENDLRALVLEAVHDGDAEFIEMIEDILPSDALLAGCLDQVKAGEWACVNTFSKRLSEDGAEMLMEIAIDQGNFDAVDMLDALLNDMDEGDEQ